MITGSLSRLREAQARPRSRGPGTTAVFPRRGGARPPGPWPASAGAGTSGEGHTAAFYWSSNANNDDNAWNLNFNNGNVNNDNKDNETQVRAVRGGR